MDLPLEIVDKIIMAQRPHYDYLNEMDQLFEAKAFYDELKIKTSYHALIFFKNNKN